MIRRVVARLSARRPTIRGAVAAVLIGGVVAAAVGGLLRVEIDTGTDSFLPAGDTSGQAMADRDRDFGGDPVVVVVKSPQPRRLLLDEDQLGRLLHLEGRLAGLPDVATVYGPATVLNQTAISAQNLLARISGRRDALRNEAEAKARRAGASEARVAAAGARAVAEFDQRYGGLVVRGLPAGLPTLRNPKFVESVVFGAGRGARPQWNFLVPAEDTVTILVRPREKLDQAGISTLTHSVRDAAGSAGLRAERITVTGVPAVTTALADRAQRELPILGAIALGAVALLYLLVPWLTRKRARLRPLAAAVAGTTLTLAAFGWLGLPLSLGVIAFLPILLGIGSDFPLYLAQPAHRRTVLVAAGAAAAGFAALALSPLPFVRELGLALAVGLGATVGVALLLRRWFDAAEPTAVGDRWATATRCPPRRTRWAVLAGVLAIASLGWVALPNLTVEARPDQLARGLSALDDAREAERVLGTSAEVSVVLKGEDVLSPEAFAWTRRASLAVVRDHGDQARPIISTAGLMGFLGAKPSEAQIKAGAALLPSYLVSSVVTPDYRSALMVFGIRLVDVEQQRELLSGIRAALPPPPPGFSVALVGLPVAAVSGYDAISDGRALLNVAGIVAAGLVLLVGLAHRRDAARAVLTVVIATGAVLAAVWVFGAALSPLTVAIGALVTATGCEFAVLLAEATRQDRPWLRRSVALAASAAVLGYSALAASEIAMLRQFGILLALGVVFSYVAAVVVNWALPIPSVGSEDVRPAVEEQGKVKTV